MPFRYTPHFKLVFVFQNFCYLIKISVTTTSALFHNFLQNKAETNSESRCMLKDTHTLLVQNNFTKSDTRWYGPVNLQVLRFFSFRSI